MTRSSSDTSADAAAAQHERAKDYLSPGEVSRLLDAAKAGRHSVRDNLLLLLMYRDGLRDHVQCGNRKSTPLNKRTQAFRGPRTGANETIGSKPDAV